jgi:hypothetical protein
VIKIEVFANPTQRIVDRSGEVLERDTNHSRRQLGNQLLDLPRRLVLNPCDGFHRQPPRRHRREGARPHSLSVRPRRCDSSVCAWRPCAACESSSNGHPLVRSACASCRADRVVVPVTARRSSFEPTFAPEVHHSRTCPNPVLCARVVASRPLQPHRLAWPTPHQIDTTSQRLSARCNGTNDVGRCRKK